VHFANACNQKVVCFAAFSMVCVKISDSQDFKSDLETVKETNVKEGIVSQKWAYVLSQFISW